MFQFISCRLHEEKQSRWAGCKLFGAFEQVEKPHFVALFGRLRSSAKRPRPGPRASETGQCFSGGKGREDNNSLNEN
jgi:hypothetical protein